MLTDLAKRSLDRLVYMQIILPENYLPQFDRV